jgi:hypothetical protein
MREEINEIKRWISKQVLCINDYITLLTPCTYKTTTKLRCLRFDTEHRFLSDRVHRGRVLIDSWNRLDARLISLNGGLYQMLKVSDENSGNAIMVFTIVATIFLPLSWATSYLGMNTADVRELRQGQWIFWTVAGPLASAVIGIALVAALKGEAIREYMIKRRYAVKNTPVKETKGIGRSNTTLSMIMGTRKHEGTGNDFWLRLRRKKRSEKETSGV